MKRRGHALVAIAALFVGMGLVTAAAIHVINAISRPDGPPPAEVPTSWRLARYSEGHRQHLETGKVQCKDCHAIDDKGFVAPGTTACATCHEETTTVHQTPVAASTTDCLSCHDFGGDRGIQRWACARCHVDTKAAPVAHFDQQCGDCHRPHETPSLEPRSCQECHDDIGVVKHGARGVKGAETCLDCHGAHDASLETSRRCQTCHTDQLRAVGAGHDSCTQCHEAHRFDAETARSCQSCHQGLPVLASATARAHADCASCHQPHDVRPGVAAQRCVSCHQKQPLAHPPDAAGKDCLSCHPAHPPRGVTLAKNALACSSCHREAPHDRAFHGKQDCAACHQPHGAKAAFKPAGTQSCSRCHAGEVTLASHNKGHRDCATCHTQAAHRPDLTPPPCAQCHAEENLTAPAGHKDCQKCHEPHEGKLRRDATCASCHQDRAKGPHTGVRGSCSSCHRAHGPGGVTQPPACVTCHAPRQLAAMHQTKGHDKCADCHGAHTEPRSDRASCLSCHKDMRNHEPTAATCGGCHPFGSGVPPPK